MVAIKPVVKKESSRVTLKKTKKPLVKKVIPSIKEEVPEAKNLLKEDASKKTVIKKKIKYVYPSKAVTDATVDLCLNALSKLTENYNTKNVLFGDENPILMQICCIKIQDTKGNIKFVLPHSTVASSGEVCLITPDLKKGKKADHDPTIDHWEELLRKADVKSVKTILPMRQLRVEYDQFELRRRLMTQHDFIMVDTRVLNHVSHLLGSMFFKKHNMLIPVHINEEKDLKKSIDIGLRTVMLRLNEGAISTVVVGHTGMTQAHIKENVVAIIQQISKKYPGGEHNIRSICLKLPLSLSLPLYLTLRSSNLIAVPKLKKSIPKEYKDYEDELSTIPGAIVKIKPDGSVSVRKTENSNKGEMHSDAKDDEIEQSMEDNDMEQSSENEE